jgi:hypothetical protein
MFKKVLLVSVLLICLFIAVGCGDGEPSAGDEDTITVEVFNNTDEIIISWAAFFGPDLDEWGEDLLGDRVIEPGDTVQFLLPVANEEYSLVLFTYELYVVKSVSDITGDTYVEVGGENKIPVLVENNSAKDIALFFVSPSVSSDWGEDLIGGLDVIPAEIGRRFLFIDPIPEGLSEDNGSGNKNDNKPENEASDSEAEERVIPEGSYYDIYYVYSDGEEVVQFDVLIEGKRTLTINE